MKIHNALVSNILDRSQRYFAYVTTVTLSWRVQNIVVIGRVYFTLECFEFSSNFEFDRNMLSGTGASTNKVIKISAALRAWGPTVREQRRGHSGYAENFTNGHFCRKFSENMVRDRKLKMPGWTEVDIKHNIMVLRSYFLVELGVQD